MDYTIHQIGKNDFELLIPLFKDCFGLDVNLDFFRWKYEQNPSGSFIGFIALDDKKEVGAYYGVIPELYAIEGTEKVIYQSCDTMTHSAHRRRGLFQTLATHCYEYLRSQDKLFVIGFGGDTSTPGFLKFGWKHVSDAQQLFYPRPLASIWFRPDPEEVAIEEIKDIAAIAHLLPQSNNNTAIHSVKSPGNFSWRISNPLYNYELYAARENGTVLTGYICFYEHRNRIYLFDFFATTKTAEKSLMHFVKTQLRQRKKCTGMITLCTVTSRVGKTAKKHFFLQSPFKKGKYKFSLPFIFYSDDETMKKYNRPEIWNLAPFDHDTM